MHKRTELQQKIQVYLPIHGARAAFMMWFVMAVVVVRGVTASTVASVLNPRVLLESNEKRIGRFFRKVEIEGEGFAKLMLALLPEKSKLVLTLDRTTWELGSVCINILMLGVAYKGLAFPLLWVLLDKKGNSDTRERLALVDKLLTLVDAEAIEAIVADREFTGKDWFKGLRKRKLVFVMRVRNNTRISSKGKTRSAQQRYDHLQPQEVYICPKRCWVFGLRLHIAVTKSKEGELVVLVCNAEPDQALLRYSRRWQIEINHPHYPHKHLSAHLCGYLRAALPVLLSIWATFPGFLKAVFEESILPENEALKTLVRVIAVQNEIISERSIMTVPSTRPLALQAKACVSNIQRVFDDVAVSARLPLHQPRLPSARLSAAAP